MKKLLITGVSGFLGWNIVSIAQSSWDIFGTVFSHKVSLSGCKIQTIDLTQYKDLKKMFSEINPDAVIHTAAVSQPNFCQNNPKISYSINVEASINIAGLCIERKIPFVFTSTDLAFDGKNPPYNEQSPVSPISTYGEHKVKAENEISARYPEAAICRMPLMFGDPSPFSVSFMQSMLSVFQSKKEIRLFKDEYRTPVSCYSAAQGLLLAIDTFDGIIHLGGKQSVSRYQFGKQLANYCNFDTSLILPILQEEIPMAAPRPENVSLDSSLSYSKGYKPPMINDEFKRLLCLK